MEIKSGQKFNAVINGTYTEGKISIEDGVIYLCQNSEDGEPCTNQYGYRYSWQYDESVDSFQVFDTKLKKWVLIEQIELSSEFSMFGHRTTIFGDIVKFGCGNVSFTKEEVLNYIEIHKLAKKNPGYLKVLDALIKSGNNMNNESFNTFQKIAKKMK